MEFSAKQIADFLKAKIEGNPDVLVNNFSKIEEGKKGTISFLSNPKYSRFIYQTKASIVLVNEDFTPEKSLPDGLTLIRVKNAYESLAALLQLASQEKIRKTGIHPLSFISESAVLEDKESSYIGAFAYIGENVVIGKNVSIYPNVYIGDRSEIGDDTILYAGVNIYEGCKIGKRCILHSGAVIGADGFGFATEEDGSFKKIPQLGNVLIEDDVEIGANTAIDRAVMESTIIHKGVKLDNLIQIAHNVEVGENTGMAAQVAVAGSTKIGKNCMIGGQVGLGGHIHIGDHVGIGAQSGTISNIEEGRKVLGSPAIGVNNFFKSSIIFAKLPEMYKELAALKKEVEKLKKEKQ